MHKLSLKNRGCFFSVLLFALAGPASADVPDGTAALSHIKKKYDYFRDWISSTEEFIELSACKSTMSGKDYTVTYSNGKAMMTRDWLLRELISFRKQKA